MTCSSLLGFRLFNSGRRNCGLAKAVSLNGIPCSHSSHPPCARAPHSWGVVAHEQRLMVTYWLAAHLYNRAVKSWRALQYALLGDALAIAAIAH